MPKKIRPRWGWKFGYDDADREARLTRVPFERLATGLGIDRIEERKAFKATLSKVIRMYYRRVMAAEQPSAEEVRATLDTLANQLSALRRSLAELDDASWIYLQDALEGQLPLDDDPRDEEELWARGHTYARLERSRLIEVCKAFEAAARDARNDPPPPRRGRRTDQPTRFLVAELATLYESITKQDAYRGFTYNDLEERFDGPFMEFAETVLGAFAPERLRSNRSLGEIVRATIGKAASDQA